MVTNKRAKNGNKLLSNLVKWISARNKQLWTGSSWTSGEKKIDGLDNYNLIAAKIYSYGTTALLYRDTSGNFTGIIGIGTSNYQAINNIRLTKKGNDVYEIQVRSIQHNANSSHSGVVENYGIEQIIGIEPILDKIVSGGGQLLKSLCCLFERGCVPCV